MGSFSRPLTAWSLFNKMRFRTAQPGLRFKIFLPPSGRLHLPDGRPGVANFPESHSPSLAAVSEPFQVADGAEGGCSMDLVLGGTQILTVRLVQEYA